MCVGKAHAVGSQAVDVGSIDSDRVVAANVPVPEVINVENDDVGVAIVCGPFVDAFPCIAGTGGQYKEYAESDHSWQFRFSYHEPPFPVMACKLYGHGDRSRN